MTYKDHYNNLLKEGREAYEALLKARAKFYAEETTEDGFKDMMNFRQPTKEYKEWQVAENRRVSFEAYAAKNGLKPNDSFVKYTEES